MRRALPFALATLLAAAALGADGERAVEVRFAPGAPDLQLVVWVEDARGQVVDTLYVTRLTGQFGLGNRPGAALLKTDFRWPFSRRVMVAPVWAHRRNRRYPLVVMGGACGNHAKSRCPDGTICAGDCEDSTVAYHPRVSSYEPFYCSPSGASKIDVLACASKGTFPKGAYADSPAYSLYPPRADLAAINPAVDSPDAADFAKRNDLVAISRATPPAGKPLSPALTWLPPPNLPDGDYTVWLETSQESDWNAFHNHPNQADSVREWDFVGHPFLGQPSVLYQVPCRLSRAPFTAVTRAYAGYGDWDGQSGALHPPDGTITVGLPGSGAGRLLEQNDGVDVYQVKVVVGQCGGAGMAPEPVTDLALQATATAIEVGFRTPGEVIPGTRYQVRYREGDLPVDDAAFDGLIAAPDPAPVEGPRQRATTRLTGLLAATAYTVAVRAVTPCNRPSKVVSAGVATPQQQYTTLKGCFVATAAWGSPLAPAVDELRRFRDRRLLPTPGGRLLAAAYAALSPPLAEAIATDRRLRAAARRLLAPIVAAVGNNI